MSGNPITILYKHCEGGLVLYLDAWPPDPSSIPPTSVSSVVVPAVIYFHAGGLTVGNKQSWFPQWMHKRLASLGYLFISADYRLLVPTTGHDIVEDIKDLWSFVTNPDVSFKFNSSDGGTLDLKVNRNAIAVAGSSAGGLCAYLCCMHCTSPKPSALLSVYGMCGDILTSHYLSTKTKPFFRGRELLDPADFEEFLYPYTKETPPTVADSPLSFHPQSYHKPGYPSNPRMLLARLYLQLGVFLDYYTGHHAPSLSSALGEACKLEENKPARSLESTLTEVIAKEIPTNQLPLFPQFNISPEWPPVVLMHGTADTAVPVNESRNIYRLLNEHGVAAKLIEFSDEEHSFDFLPDAEEKWGPNFDAAIRCLHDSMANPRP